MRSFSWLHHVSESGYVQHFHLFAPQSYFTPCTSCRPCTYPSFVHHPSQALTLHLQYGWRYCLFSLCMFLFALGADVCLGSNIVIPSASTGPSAHHKIILETQEIRKMRRSRSEAICQASHMSRMLMSATELRTSSSPSRRRQTYMCWTILCQTSMSSFAYTDALVRRE